MHRVRLLVVLFLASWAVAQRARYFKITVVDEATGRGVPLVDLTTTGGIRHTTDSNGIVAFHEPGLMGRAVFFHVKSHGYEFKKDGFGFRGQRLTPVAGKSAVLKIKRINVAERLYRVTGGGIYRDSLLTGHAAPVAEPLLNGRVLGQDTVQVTPYRGKLYWFWGDTNRVSYPLGNFGASGATSELPGKPGAGIDLTYFVGKDGFSRPMCAVPGPGPKWIDGLMTVKDKAGRVRLVAKYVRVKTLDVMLERGLVIYDDAKEIFEPLVRFDLDNPIYPRGHPIRVERFGQPYYYFGAPFPDVRVPADLRKIRDPQVYEAFADGAWRHGVAPDLETRLTDIDTGKSVRAHGGSVFWSEYRKRWIAIILESGGTSYLGEIWYAEADTILGPWVYARKIVTHDKYSFYNPTQHPYFDRKGGRIIYFEGTYTNTFSRTKVPTPRYNYNQIMYRLDLADPRLVLPVPVYRLEGGKLATKLDLDRLKEWPLVRLITFFAPDRSRAGLVQNRSFHVLPKDTKNPPPGTIEVGVGRVWSNPGVRLLVMPDVKPLPVLPR